MADFLNQIMLLRGSICILQKKWWFEKTLFRLVKERKVLI